MESTSGKELKEKLDRGDDFKLVMVLGDWGFRAKHIPGSLNILAPDVAASEIRWKGIGETDAPVNMVVKYIILSLFNDKLTEPMAFWMCSVTWGSTGFSRRAWRRLCQN